MGGSRRYRGVVAAVVLLAVGVLPRLPGWAAADPLPADTRRTIARRAGEAVAALRARDTARLSRFVHPDKGLRFSPYVFVQPDSDRVFTRAQVARLARDPGRYHWGAYDGSGEPIRLTFAEYHKRFVYDKHYARAREINVNTFKRRGNTTNNLRSAYPKSVAVEYHVPGVGEQRDHNWGSLWLVWQKKGAAWYLVGIAHDAWTI